EAIMKVSFPTFSRLQDRPDILKNSIEKSVYFIALFSFPTLAGISLVAPDFINIIPKYTKWSPAIIPLYFYAANAAIAAVTTPLTNAFNAVGKITLTTRLMLMWTALTWIFYPLLSSRYGYIGTAVAALIVGSSSFVVWLIVHKLFKANVLKAVSRPLLGTIIMILLLLPLSQTTFSPLQKIITKIFLGSTSYLLFIIMFSKNDLFWFTSQLKQLRGYSQR
ncbi:MAG: oligosaccharide flippase family protein, partial [Patescibacteria group bacterium]